VSSLPVPYVCPRCKAPLDNLACTPCGVRYTVIAEDIPCFLEGSPGSDEHAIREIYDEIYRHHEDVWVDQGRSEVFVRYFGSLAASYSQGSLLEIGCGEGAQLAALTASCKFGVDLSVNALRRARKRSGAACAVARAEELPFPSESFDLVIAVGVMEHFEHPDAACAEIRRVLTRSGRYIALIHTDLSWSARLALKARQFLVPRPRPIALLKWLRKKMLHPIVQPLRRSYTIDAVRARLECNGLRLSEVITRDTHPDAPLAGRHVVILVAEQAALRTQPA
jgi:ubiquinone/menaquinone biosynthesis C-methylase UbiE